MTAATWTSTRCGATIQARAGIDLTAAVSTYEITEAIEANDIFQMVKVPAGAVVHEVILGVDDLDTASSPAITLIVGDGDDTDRFIASSTIGQAGGITRLSNIAGVGYQYTDADTIDVKCGVAPTTGATSGTITLVVLYSMQDDV